MAGARTTLQTCSPDFPITVEKFLLWFFIHLYERNYPEAERYIAKRSELLHHEMLIPDVCFEGFVARARNDSEKAASAFLNCRDGLEVQLREHPDIAIWLSSLALADSALGRKEEAYRESARAVEVSDSLDRSAFVLDPANIYCWLGEHDHSLEELGKVAKTTIGVSYGDLRFNPAWDSLRDDPRFAQILADAAAPIPLP